MAIFVGGPMNGALQSSSNGAFIYTPGVNFVGSDSFQYQAQAGSSTSNIATVFITVISGSTGSPTPPKLLPDTPYFNYLRRRRSIDPPRFDFYHPQIGTLIGLEISGIPTKPTKIVPLNAHFNASADRRQYEQNPQRFDQKQPFLGALFALETPGATLTNLLPQTSYYENQQALYESNPTKYQLKNVYLGAIFAIEDFERGGSVHALASTSSLSSSSVVKVGSAHLAAAQMGHGKLGARASR